jgi:hypothetical protein
MSGHAVPIGQAVNSGRLQILRGDVGISLSLQEIRQAWQSPLDWD